MIRFPISGTNALHSNFPFKYVRLEAIVLYIYKTSECTDGNKSAFIYSFKIYCFGFDSVGRAPTFGDEIQWEFSASSK